MNVMSWDHIKRGLPSVPLSVWLLGLALWLGLSSGQGAHGFVSTFNAGFGRALGEFALILLPSFVLAAAMERHSVRTTGRLPLLVAPWAGAGMVCPDTAYAALSPIAGRQKLAVAMGAYAGFKLLFPAGPLIVATGLGLGQGQMQNQLLWYSLLVFLPVWGVGVWWAWRMGGSEGVDSAALVPTSTDGVSSNMGRLLAPFILMALLLGIGMFWESRSAGLLYLTQPKGALMAAAMLAWWLVPPDGRRDCLDAALRRTGSLLLVIGMASAFGAVLLGTGVLDGWALAGKGWRGVLSLFVLTALFKLIQGSSMATFAAVTPVAAAFQAISQLPVEAAVLAICAGSFVSILPNDSFYWLVRRDALVRTSEGRSLAVLAMGSLLQALTALVTVGLVVL